MSLAWTADEPAKTPSAAEQIYEKALVDSTKDAEKQYEIYCKALDAANDKVLKALEAAKKDLNDPKKGKLTISERAKALEELDERIKNVSGGAVSDWLIAKKASYAETMKGGKEDLAKAIVGKWTRSDNYDCDFRPNGTGTVGSYIVKWVVNTDTISFTFQNQPEWTMNVKKSSTGFVGTLDNGKVIILTPKSK